MQRRNSFKSRSDASKLKGMIDVIEAVLPTEIAQRFKRVQTKALSRNQQRYATEKVDIWSTRGKREELHIFMQNLHCSNILREALGRQA